MYHAYLFGNLPRERPAMHHVDQIDRHILVNAPQRAHLLVGNAAGRADRAVLVENREGLRECAGHIGLGGNLEHVYWTPDVSALPNSGRVQSFTPGAFAV